MVKGFVCALICWMILCASVGSFSIERPKQTISIGGGTFGGMAAAMFDTNYIVLDNMFIKVGLDVSDSANLSPNKDWRRYAALCVDAVYYYSDNSYFGLGANYPLKISDDEQPAPGGEVYLGMDLPIYHRGKIYVEAGYSSLGRAVGEAFGGLHLLAGWRYDIVPAPSPNKAAISESPPAETAVPSPEAAAIEVRSASAEAQRKKVMSEIIELKGELEKAENYVSQLDKKIVKAKSDNAVKKVLELKTLKLDVILRAQSIKDKIKEKEARL